MTEYAPQQFPSNSFTTHWDSNRVTIDDTIMIGDPCLDNPETLHRRTTLAPGDIFTNTRRVSVKLNALFSASPEVPFTTMNSASSDPSSSQPSQSTLTIDSGDSLQVIHFDAMTQTVMIAVVHGETRTRIIRYIDFDERRCNFHRLLLTKRDRQLELFESK